MSIAKVEGANRVRQFRPIILLDCSFKISKAMANRLGKVINLLIDKSKVGFIREIYP